MRQGIINTQTLYVGEVEGPTRNHRVWIFRVPDKERSYFILSVEERCSHVFYHDNLPTTLSVVASGCDVHTAIQVITLLHEKDFLSKTVESKNIEDVTKTKNKTKNKK